MEFFHFSILPEILIMKQFKILIAGILLLFSTAVFAQIKKHKIPPPPPTAVTPPPVITDSPPPPPPEIRNGHPWTRNGENVWVARPTIKLKNGKWVVAPLPPPPPPPPPLPPKQIED